MVFRPDAGPRRHAVVEMSETAQMELFALAELPDDKINTAAIPEQMDWSGAKRGVFHPKVWTWPLILDILDKSSVMARV